MRETVVFLVNTPTPKGAGFEDAYTTLLTTRGQMIESGDSRGLNNGILGDSTFKRLRCRFQSALATNLRSDTKLVISGLTYTMNGMPYLVDQKKHLYEFKIQAETN